MTIYLQNPLTSIAPAVKLGIEALDKKVLRPDKEEEDMIKKALAEGRLTQEELNNMSVNEFASKFGVSTKTAAKYTTGVKNARKIADEIDAGEMQRIMALPQDNLERQEYLANRNKTLTPTQRTIQGNQASVAANEAKLSQMEIDAIKADIASGDPLKIEAAQARLARRQTKDVLRMQNVQADEAVIDAETKRNMRGAAVQIMGKYGPSNLFAGVNDPNNNARTTEMAAVMGDEQARRVYEAQKDEYWRRTQMNFQRELSNGKADQRSADIIVARKISEKVRGTVGVDDIVKVIQDPTWQTRFRVLDKDGNPTEKLIDEKLIAENERNLYRAVKAIDTARDADYQKEVKDAYDKLRIAGKSIYEKLNSPRGLGQSGMDNAQIESLINEYNTYALQYLGGIIPSSEIPKIGISETGGFLGIGKNKFVELLQGKDPLLTTKKKEGADSTTAEGELADPAMQQAVDLLIAGTGTEEQLKASGKFTDEEIKIIVDRVKAKKVKK